MYNDESSAWELRYWKLRLLAPLSESRASTTGFPYVDVGNHSDVGSWLHCHSVRLSKSEGLRIFGIDDEDA